MLKLILQNSSFFNKLKVHIFKQLSLYICHVKAGGTILPLGGLGFPMCIGIEKVFSLDGAVKPLVVKCYDNKMV